MREIQQNHTLTVAQLVGYMLSPKRKEHQFVLDVLNTFKVGALLEFFMETFPECFWLTTNYGNAFNRPNYKEVCALLRGIRKQYPIVKI